MKTEYDAINRAIKLSKTEFIDEIVIVFKKEDGSYGVLPESTYIGDDDAICGKYFRGNLAPI
jgi:hypothetical protein